MTFSLNEVEALAKRAARGSGLSWGLSEEAAKNTRWLASFGLPGPGSLADLLELNDRAAHADLTPVSLDGAWHGPIGRLSPLIAGATMSDCAERMTEGRAIEMHNVSQPLLLIPFAGGAAMTLHQPVAVAWASVRAVTDGLQLMVEGNERDLLVSLAPRVRCSARSVLGAARGPGSRATVDKAGWARLAVFAHRTLAPATDESRRRGAGPSDND